MKKSYLICFTLIASMYQSTLCANDWNLWAAVLHTFAAAADVGAALDTHHTISSWDLGKFNRYKNRFSAMIDIVGFHDRFSISPYNAMRLDHLIQHDAHTYGRSFNDTYRPCTFVRNSVQQAISDLEHMHTHSCCCTGISPTSLDYFVADLRRLRDFLSNSTTYHNENYWRLW
jgi:hypothetical protein